jgi:hypothetical protein
MTAKEQRQRGRPQRMSSVLWDLFTGSAPYREVFLSTLHPIYIKDLLWNLIAGNVKRTDKSKQTTLSKGVGDHDIH